MTRARRAVFFRVLAGLLLAQGALGLAVVLLLPWGTRTWLEARGRRLVQAAEAVAAGVSASEVCAVAAGDTTSPRFVDALGRLEKMLDENPPPPGSTGALFVVEQGASGPRLSIRVASYPPYLPDDGLPSSSPLQLDQGCVDRVLAGTACSSPEPYGGRESGEATLISGYAPIRGSDGTVKAVAVVDLNVLPLSTLQGAARWAFFVAASGSAVLLPLVAWVWAGWLVGGRASAEAPSEALAPAEAPALQGSPAQEGASALAEASALGGAPALAEASALGGPSALAETPALGGAPALAEASALGGAPALAKAPAPAETPALAGAPPRPSPFFAAIDARWGALSEREVELVGYVGQALGTRDIADRMCVQESTVKQHLKNIYRELGIHSREELVVISVYKLGFRLEGSPAPSDEG